MEMAEDLAVTIVLRRGRQTWDDLDEDDQEKIMDKLVAIDEKKWNNIDELDELESSPKRLMDAATEILQAYVGKKLEGVILVQAYQQKKANQAAQIVDIPRATRREQERKKLAANPTGMPSCVLYPNTRPIYPTIKIDETKLMGPNEFHVQVSQKLFDNLFGNAYIELHAMLSHRRVYARIQLPHNGDDNLIIVTPTVFDMLGTFDAVEARFCNLQAPDVPAVTGIGFAVYGEQQGVNMDVLQSYLAKIPAISVGTELFVPDFPTLRVDELYSGETPIFMGTLKIATYADSYHEWVVEFKTLQCRVCGDVAKYKCPSTCGAAYCGEKCQTKDWTKLHRHFH